MMMDGIGLAEDDYGMDDVVIDDGFEERPGRRLAPEGPQDVTFSVALEKELNPGEVVVLTGTCPEIRDGIFMATCPSDNRLWTVTVSLDIRASTGAVAASHTYGGALGAFGGMMTGLSGGFGVHNSTTSGPHLFDVNYSVVTQTDAKVVHKEEKPWEEHGKLKNFYYHRARFNKMKDEDDVLSFPLFVHDEIFRLQNNMITQREFISRFQTLAGAPFAKKRSLLDKAIEELIAHWGDATPPMHVMLCIAAAIGHFQKQDRSGGLGWADMQEGGMDFGNIAAGMGAKEKEKEPPLSEKVCKWIVTHCPTRAQVDEEERRAREAKEKAAELAKALAASKGEAPPAAERGRDRHDLVGQNHMTRLANTGVLAAAERIYIGNKSFDWLKLLQFLPEHQLPSPISASQLPSEDRDLIEKNFDSCYFNYITQIYQYKLTVDEKTWGDTEAELKEKQREETILVNYAETFLRGLTTFCPSIRCLEGLFDAVKSRLANHSLAQLGQQQLTFLLSRLRTLNFGKKDQDDMKALLKRYPMLCMDDVAVSLLTNQHHPSDSFKTEEIVQFVKLVTIGRAAGQNLQQAAKRWLSRNFVGRDRADRARGEEARSLPPAEYKQQKDEIKNLIAVAIKGWHMVLSVPCFSQEEECLRLIVFDLTQAHFFKDYDHYMVLDAMLELEDVIKQTRSVKHVEDELVRVMVRLTRDVIENDAVSEAEGISKALLDLLFLKPTEKRCYIIDALISMRQASGSIFAIVRNQNIWSRLLSKEWYKNAALQSYEPLRQTQSTGNDILARTSKAIISKEIQLGELHTILDHEQEYMKLIEIQDAVNKGDSVMGVIAPKTADARKIVTLFDNEHTYLRTYLTLYCNAGGIQCVDLNKLQEEIQKSYQHMKLQAAQNTFQGMAVRPHLGWLYELRGSEVFIGIWKLVCGVDVEEISLGKSEKSQTEVVNTIIPEAKKKWEALAKSIENGTAILQDIRWCVDMIWNAVKRELLLLEATAPKAAAWSAKAIEMTEAMRLAAKLKAWAPAMLHLKEVLQELFKSMDEGELEQELRRVEKTHEAMWTMKLGQMIDLTAPFAASIKSVTPEMQDYIIALSQHDDALKHVLTHTDLDRFNSLMKLVTPNTQDAVILAALSSLRNTRTFLSETLYSSPPVPYTDLRAFLKQLATLVVDEQTAQSLDSVQTNFAPLHNLLTTQSRSPGVQACYDLIEVSEKGLFVVKVARSAEQQISCIIDGQEREYEKLQDMRQHLLMVEVPEEINNVPKKQIEQLITEFVQKFQLFEDCGRCAHELFDLGYFAYEDGQEIVKAKPKESVEVVQKEYANLQETHTAWTQAVEDARAAHYYLNYFTVCELAILAKGISEMDKNPKVWPLLRVVDPTVDEKELRSKIAKNSNLKSCEKGEEAERLKALGRLLGDLFGDMKITTRSLKGVKVSKALAQGDVAIGAKRTGEEGNPIYVCCTSEGAASKVTELILSIYARRERVPEAEELLLCSGNTTVEQVELLLWRFFNARKHKREERLYCLGNIHLLPYVVQVGTMENLRRLEAKFGYEQAGALVFVSGMSNHMLMNALVNYNINTSIMAEDSLRDAVEKVGQMYHGQFKGYDGFGIQAVTAKMSGMGKTHYILREISKWQAKLGDKPIRHRVEIRETTDVTRFVQDLLDDPTDDQHATAIHVDLAHILPTYVDTLLFEVLVVGMLRDPGSGTVYHRRPQDFFYIEVPNTPEEDTAMQLSFCLLLPRKYLQMPTQTGTGDTKNTHFMDTEFPVLEEVPNDNKSKTNPVKVNFVKNTHLVLCGKTLQAMSKEMFQPKSKDFKVTWKAATEAEIPVEDTYKLLYDVCTSDTSPPCYLVFMNFVKFMGEMITMAEGWNMMNLQLLQNFDPGLKHFKHSFFKLLIETSRDFALRQVPKGTSADYQKSYLNPSRLLRATSGGGTLSRLSPGAQHSVGGSVLARSKSTRSQNETTTQDIESGGIGRADVRQYVNRITQMPAWENMVHPIASFKKNETGTIIGCNIMSLDKDFLGTFIDRNLQNSLNLNDLKLERDWTAVTHQEAVQLVIQVEGGELLRRQNQISGPKEYVVTVDNLIKLMSIQQRLRFDLPVILMGETGCGKTALVKFLAQTLDFKLHTLDVHGGITDDQIINFVQEAVDGTRVPGSDVRGALVFFDEINAANCMAMFKSIIIDRVYGNKVLPKNVRVISCCNPYRIRKNEELEAVGIVANAAATGASGIKDPMRKLVYRVHPLPESLMDVVSDFGALSEASEEKYILAILKKELPFNDADGADTREYDEFMECFKDLLCASQTYVRDVNNKERSVVSMRDIARAAKVFKWFLLNYSRIDNPDEASPVVSTSDGVQRINMAPEMRPHYSIALLLTLGYCYHARLNRNQRWNYRKKMCDTWKNKYANKTVDWINLKQEDEFGNRINEIQTQFVSAMKMDDGVSLNEALRENLFMLLVSIMNQIPILIVGKPGCSKSLAMEVLQNNLNGSVSTVKFFQSMPAVEVYPYQCSPLSTPEAIQGAFSQARHMNTGGSQTIVTVLLDEVGLAEESPHLPLKVLHKELEDLQGIACVGISNWNLDAAKMSRCVTLYRPPPTVEDLILTANGMVSSAVLQGWLESLSHAFFEVYKAQKREDFWGMREFYSTVRVINSELRRLAEAGEDTNLSGQILMKTVQRNFGGCAEDDTEICIDEFFERTGIERNKVEKYTTSQLIEQNLRELDARHLMLLTKNNAALRLLFESKILDHGSAEVMFGGTFPGDLKDVSIAMSLQKIKTYMQKPIALVMVHCDSLYESLYDLFNQHYMTYSGRRYVRIAHGSKSTLREVNESFRVVVITEMSDAYFRLAPPLLNRFEKQIFKRSDLMTGRQDGYVLKHLEAFWDSIKKAVGIGEQTVGDEYIEFEKGAKVQCRNSGEPEWLVGVVSSGEGEPLRIIVDGSDAGRAFDEVIPFVKIESANCVPIAGFHPELLSSLAFVACRSKSLEGADDAKIVAEARRKLTAILTPEAVCICASKYKKEELEAQFQGLDIVNEYFQNQSHSDLPSFAESLTAKQNENSWIDNHGAQVMALTYSPIRGKCGSDIGPGKLSSVAPDEVSLHDLSSSHDLEKLVSDFYDKALLCPEGDNRFLLFHADPMSSNLRMIELCRYYCEKIRKRKFEAGTMKGNVFVIVVVHLQRGMEKKFSFDFDSQWDFVFLDSVAPSTDDIGMMPSLGDMLNMPLGSVVKGVTFDRLLKQVFRSALSRLMYPLNRDSKDLQDQINLLLKFLEDEEFVKMARTWTLEVLNGTLKDQSDKKKGTFGSDKHWYSEMASETQKLQLAGTFRAALAGKISTLVTSMFTTLLAHLDRNYGLQLLADDKKRKHWLLLQNDSLSSALSGRLMGEKVSALTEEAHTQHEVSTDAQTAAKPFISKFPASWYVSAVLTASRPNVENLKVDAQLKALEAQFGLTKLHEIGFDPTLGGDEGLLDDYLSDLTAMHLDYTERFNRDSQKLIMRKSLVRAKGGPLTGVLEMHQLFWQKERFIAFAVGLLNEAPRAMDDACKLIENESLDWETLDLELLLLIIQTLNSELLTPPKDVKQKDVYREWNRRKQVVSGYANDFLARCRVENDCSKKLRSVAQPRMDTLSLLLSHVAHPLDVPLQHVNQFAADLPTDKIRHAKTLQAMLTLADKVKALDTNLTAMGSFVESWILDVCLGTSEAMTDLDGECLQLFCALSCGLPLKVAGSTVAAASFKEWKDFIDVCIATCPGGAEIPRSQCLNLALLKKLIGEQKASDASKQAEKHIHALLQDLKQDVGHSDTTFATKFTVLQEEAATKKLKGSKPVDWETYRLEDVFPHGPGGDNPAKILQHIGTIRYMLGEYAMLLCNESIRTDAQQLADYTVMTEKVEKLLITKDPLLEGVCRSMRLFLLKCMERKKGVSYVRGALAETPLCDAEWVKEWRLLHDIDFEKFIGAALVPKWNPFHGDDATFKQAYEEARLVVMDTMTANSVQPFLTFSNSVAMKENNKGNQKKAIAGLLLALCQEPGLLAALEDKEVGVPEWRPLLSKFLKTNDTLPVSPQERMLLRLFSGDSDILKTLECDDELLAFVVDSNSGMDRLLRWRFLGHMAAALIAAPDCSLLSSLRSLMLNPKTLVETGVPYLPGMDEDIRNRVMKALVERGENIWKMKAHWYNCYCGYQFFIGECGRPMEVTKCPECGRDIGGKDHTQTSNTQIDDEKDRSPIGYVLPAAHLDEKHVTFREITAGSSRAIRLMLHAAMFLGTVAHIPAEAGDKPEKSIKLGKIFAGLCNTDTCTMVKESEPKYVGDHFLNDFTQMVELLGTNTEDLCLNWHQLLHQMCAGDMKDSSGSGSDSNWSKLTINARQQWEDVIQNRYLMKMIKEHDQRAPGLLEKWGGGAGEDGKFVSEIKEVADVKDFTMEIRTKRMPQIWAFRGQVTLEALHARMAKLEKPRVTYPVLSNILEQQYYPILDGLRTLVGVFEWHHLVRSKFGGRITRTQAGQLTPKDVMSGLPQAERVKWERAFNHYKEAWRIAFKYVERFECTEIPENLRQIHSINEDISMLMCICDDKNEGICPTALTQWLVERHNELAQVVAIALRHPPRKISSRLLGQHDVMAFGPADLMQFLTSRCVTYAPRQLAFDLDQIERHVRRELARPEIVIEIRAFQWLGEASAQGAQLQTILKQSPLSPEICDRIRAEIATPMVANTCLQKVNMGAIFLMRTSAGLGDEKAGDMLLKEYFTKILCDNSNESLPSTTACSEVHLKHMDAFTRLLRQIIDADPMDMVDIRFREALPKELKDELSKRKGEIPGQFSGLLATVAEAHLHSDGGFGPDADFLPTLNYMWNDANHDAEDLAKLEKMLKECENKAGEAKAEESKILVKHWVAVYRLVKELEK